MPAYNKSPFKAVPNLMIPGRPSYFYGSYNDKTGPTLGTVISVALSGTTATVVFQILQGNVPQVDSTHFAYATIIGTTVQGGQWNVTNATVLTVSMDSQADGSSKGICTITFTLVGTQSPTASDIGQVMIPQQEVAEALVQGSSVPVAAANSSNASPEQGRALSVNVSFPSVASSPALTAQVWLQGANIDMDSEYEDIAEVVNVSGNVQTGGDWNSGQGVASTNSGAAVFPFSASGVNLLNYRFYRLSVRNVTGTATIIAKIEC